MYLPEGVITVYKTFKYYSKQFLQSNADVMWCINPIWNDENNIIIDITESNLKNSFVWYLFYFFAVCP